jgi:hypothetical protein
MQGRIRVAHAPDTVGRCGRAIPVLKCDVALSQANGAAIKGGTWFETGAEMLNGGTLNYFAVPWGIINNPLPLFLIVLIEVRARSGRPWEASHLYMHGFIARRGRS